MSHVIPSWLFQVLKSDRWNCNVFWGTKKSEGTQITCDFWEGEVGARPEAGGWVEAGRGSASLGPGGRGEAGASRAPAFGEAGPTYGPISEGLTTIRSFVTACRARPRGAPIC